MRRTLRQLAAAKPARYLEPHAPTGLTGLFTHPAPRSTLIYLYSSTLERLRAFPESSLYRQSTEAVTKHRMDIVNSIVPDGYAEWAAKTKQTLEEHPEVFTTPDGGEPHDEERHVKEVRDGKNFIKTKVDAEYDDTRDEWDGEEDVVELEGTRTQEERKGQATIGRQRPGSDIKTVTLDPEPPLTADQISEMENKIGAGLIEEVIQVAVGELKLTDVMLQAKAWENLEDKPTESQWTYFSEGRGTPSTPPPPEKS